MAAPQDYFYESNGVRFDIRDRNNITKAECLELARAGKDQWNFWRRASPVRLDETGFNNFADFSGVDFKNDSIDFSDFFFGDHTSFEGARFGNRTLFARSDIGNWANFSGAVFGFEANFDGANLGNWANFKRTKFGTIASFMGTQFGNPASFDGANFGETTTFRGAQFAGRASFECAEFEGSVQFCAATWASISDVYGNLFSIRRAWAELFDAAPNAFGNISFDGALFGATADFTDRKFLSRASFDSLQREKKISPPKTAASNSNIKPIGPHAFEEITFAAGRRTIFGRTPVFHGCQLRQDTTFDHAKFPDTSGKGAAARAYRTLKLAFSQQQAIREEQRFFKLEMQEEAASLEPGWKRWLYRRYDYFSDFGFSIWRPLGRLVLLPSLIFGFAYWTLIVLGNETAMASPLALKPEFASQWLQFTFANMAPLPDSGLLKELRNNLFGNAVHSSMVGVFALVLETTQKLLALIGYFLMGLALRNLFKMK